MRVLMISRCPPHPLHLGDRLIIWHLSRALARQGVELDLLAFADRPEDAETDWSAPDARAGFRDIEIVPAPRRTLAAYARRLALPGARFPRRARQAWSPDMWARVEARRARAAYDAAHLFGGVQVYEYARALGGLPAVITPYESYSLYLRRLMAHRPRLSTRAQWWAARRYEAFMFAPYRAAVVVSPLDRAELLALDPALRVEVIPNGVDLDYFQPQPVAREPDTLLFTGNFAYAPNIDAALYLAQTLLPGVQARFPGARLWLVGADPPPAVQALASASVTVTGRVPDLRPYLARAAVYVCPLRIGAGIKNKVLEALAMGCPLAATPLSVDGIAVRAGQDALVAPAAGGALAAAVARLLADAELRAAFSANGPALIARDHSWAGAAARYAALYAGG
ncbi:MAG: glycosyl transferase family 1 [Chloroflexota bacterium]|nr:MAG: glycosyl transferase family 1 [Chloroflexota bacterium]